MDNLRGSIIDLIIAEEGNPASEAPWRAVQGSYRSILSHESVRFEINTLINAVRFA